MKNIYIVCIIMVTLNAVSIRAQNPYDHGKLGKRLPYSNPNQEFLFYDYPVGGRWGFDAYLVRAIDQYNPLFKFREEHRIFQGQMRRYMDKEEYFPSNHANHPTHQQNLTNGVREAWVSHYASGLAPGINYPSAMVVDDSGYVYVAGSTLNPPFGLDYVVVKYDSIGNQLWLVKYNGEGNVNDYARALEVDGEENVYVAGTSEGAGTSDNFVTIKYNRDGVHQWTAHYNSSGNYNDRAEAMVIDSKSNVYVTGESRNIYVTIKYNREGVQQWVAELDEPNIAGSPRDISIDSKDNIYVTGDIYATGDNSYSRTTVKYDPDGLVQWVVRYNTNSTLTHVDGLVVDDSDNIYVTGDRWVWSESGSVESADYVTIKYNSDGVEQWAVVYNGAPRYDGGKSSLAVDYSGNVYVTGRSQGAGGGADNTLIKYDRDGNQLWVEHYTSLEDFAEYLSGLAIDGQGNVYVTGGLYSGSSYDYTTIKYNGAGIEQWKVRYDGPNSKEDVAYAVALDRSGNIYVTGISDDLDTGKDIATIKYNSKGIEQWVTRYATPEISSDAPSDITFDALGNVYVTGRSEDSETGNDIITIKYNNVGVHEWTARYNGPADESDVSSAIALDNFGNIYITGSSTGLNTHEDYITIKYTSAGEEVWVARYDGPGHGYDSARTIAADGQGNVYVTGQSEGTDTKSDFATIKYTSNGIEKWVARYDGSISGWDGAVGLTIDGMGDVYVTGWSDEHNQGDIRYTDDDVVTIKYNSDGEQVWLTRHDLQNGNDRPVAIAVDHKGNAYVTGTGKGMELGEDFVTIKYNSKGLKQWIARYDGPVRGNDWPVAIALDGKGNVYVSGNAWSSTRVDYATVKYNAFGEEQWVATYNGPGSWDDAASDLSVDGLGNIYVTGSSFSPDTGYDFTTIKYSPDGGEQWVARYNSPENTNDAAMAIAVDGWGTVYVTGGTGGSIYDGSVEITTIKYIQEENLEKPRTYYFSQNYPNPFNSSTQIQYRLENSCQVKLKIYNLRGQEIETLVNGNQIAGEYEVQWKPTNISNGIYIYRLYVKDRGEGGQTFTEVKKLVLTN